jgi:microcystin synthetase protein McyJ
MDKPLTHEDHVEKFYSHGSEIRAREADGFLSFGYWNPETKDYFESAENLVQFFLKEGAITNPEVILDVACGYGAESFRFFDALKPQKMRCIDITQPHIDFAKKRAEEKGLQDHLIFEKRDACRTGFADGLFSQVVGIEGPAHFNTRMDFFKEAYRVLKQKGELILTDIIFDIDQSKKSGFLKKVTELGAKKWHMPEANKVNSKGYQDQLREVGFRVEKFLNIGDHVFPGFARFNVKWDSIKNAVKTRGLSIGLGLTLISWLLGYGYRNGVIDYVFVKAVKE